jgi:hypothetical protein
MIPPEVLQAISQFGTWVVFLYLFVSERKRSTEIQEARIAEHKQFEKLLYDLCVPDKVGEPLHGIQKATYTADSVKPA